VTSVPPAPQPVAPPPLLLCPPPHDDPVIQAATRAIMDGLVVVDLSTAMPAASLAVVGTLALRQRTPLAVATGHRCVELRSSPPFAQLPLLRLLPRLAVTTTLPTGPPLPRIPASSTQLSTGAALPLGSARGVEDLSVATILASYQNRNGA
jgi:hypothetical protein